MRPVIFLAFRPLFLQTRMATTSPSPFLSSSGSPWAPHQGLPYWSPGIASSHNMAPHILSQSLERFFFPGQKESGVCLTVDWNAAAHRSPVGLNTCCFSLLLHKELLEFCQVNYSFFQFNLISFLLHKLPRSSRCIESLCNFGLF